MYVGDPVMAVPVGASVEENHVHHLHNHRWKETPGVENSDTIDSQTLGNGTVYESPYNVAFGEPEAGINDFTSVHPEMSFDEAFEVGAGGAHKSVGDVLFHCHLFPHYGEGMWGIMRMLDRERDGLKKLPNNEPPLPKDSEIKGYPEFIPNEFGDAPPFPPYGAAGLDDFRYPEPEEEKALTRRGEIKPGAPYTDPCETDVEGHEPAFESEEREYTIVALPADIVYVLEEHADLVKEGKMNPEPLVIRANVGNCVNITLKNEITEENIAAIPGDRFPENPENEDIGAESVPIQEGGKSTHIHFVSYDLLGSDSLANGFNYRQDTESDDQNHYRWYADEEEPSSSTTTSPVSRTRCTDRSPRSWSNPPTRGGSTPTAAIPSAAAPRPSSRIPTGPISGSSVSPTRTSPNSSIETANSSTPTGTQRERRGDGAQLPQRALLSP